MLNDSNNSDDGDYDMGERGNSNGGSGGEEMMFCQPVSGAVGGENKNNNLPTFQEVDMEEEEESDRNGPSGGGYNNNTPNHGDGDHNNEGGGDGSDVSSAEKYADRNSDPGMAVHQEADYALPIMPGHHPSQSRLHDGPHGASMGLTNVMDPNMGGGGGGGMGGTGMGGPSGNESVSLGTATQTHEVRMPMLLPSFKPATGCTNASDFIVRCFVARLRSGITVVKHGRSRWCKSRLRVLHVHPDGRSLSWKPALGEPSSGKRPPKLDLTSCKEVRHAWSPDPDNPMFTGTPILRQKCEAANAHKSFALIFPKRTVDITAVTADQCKVLMEGFSALCFRLQVAQNVASSGGAAAQAGGNKAEGGGGGEDKAATASLTATNTSMRPDSPKRKGVKKRSFR